MYSDFDVVFWKDVGNGLGPFDDSDGVLVVDGFGKVFEHEAGIGKAVEIIMNELFVVW